jgi:hypothetical protein
MEKKRCVLTVSVMTMSVLILCAAFSSTVFALEPKPGDVINAGNVDQYAEYFPSFMVKFIKGVDFLRPVVVKVKETEIYTNPKSYEEWTEKNRGKLQLDAENNIVGEYQAGAPFPDPKEPKLAEKVMWNFYYRWRSDQWSFHLPGWVAYSQRKGGPITYGSGVQHYIYFTNRTAVDPKPLRPNPHGLFFAFVQYILDGVSKEMDFLIWRYSDPKKADDMWTYVPTLRRTLRLVSSERANPVRGTAACYDDYYGFDGKIHEFNYKYLGQKKMLCLMHQQTVPAAGDKYFNGYDHPVLDQDAFELWDHHLIEITAKDPRYPESKRLLWSTVGLYHATAAETYDKGGGFWKGLFQSYKPTETETGEVGPWMKSQGYTDFKTEYWTGVIGRTGIDYINGDKIDATLLEPGVLGSEIFY